MSENNPGAMDMTVKVFPVQSSKNLFATASVTLGGCFAVCGIQIRDGKNGAFVSMPQRKDAKGEYHDICFPTTAEMRQAINAAVLGEYERTAQRDQSRGSVLDAMRDTQAKPGRAHEGYKSRNVETR
uniref:SpoVG family protein n=1 Tax=Candidatus Scatomorpha intestinigallinarum TaxID=2840923 RepID=UPI004026A606